MKRFFYNFALQNKGTREMSAVFGIFNFIIRKRYLLVILFFVFEVTFCGIDSAVNLWHRQKELRQMRSEIATKQTSYAEGHDFLERLNNNHDLLEKIGREKFGMKRANEDVFLIVENPTEEVVAE